MGQVRPRRQREFRAVVVGDTDPCVLPVEMIHATDAQVVKGPARPRSIAEQDEVEPAGAKVPLPAVPRIALVPDRRGKRLVVTGEWASAMPCRVGSCQAKDTDLVRAA